MNVSKPSQVILVEVFLKINFEKSWIISHFPHSKDQTKLNELPRATEQLKGSAGIRTGIPPKLDTKAPS